MGNWFKKLPESYSLKRNTFGEIYFQHDLSKIGGNVFVGAHTYIHGTTKTKGAGLIAIGKFCSIADAVIIHSGDNHSINHISTYPFGGILGLDIEYADVVGEEVIIGNDVWIGEGVRILSGSKIGDGSVIGAGSVVRGVVDAYSVVVGNPSKLLKKRFDVEVINYLVELKWWAWPIDKILRNAQFFSLDLKNICPKDCKTLIDALIV